MKYLEQAQEKFFFDFVFYEVEKKTMYVYCPNCGREHEIIIEKSVKDIKENLYPCSCFNGNKIPAYKNDIYEHRNLNQLRTVGEFSKNSKNEAVLNVYWVTASFGANLYSGFGRIFRRSPIYDEDLVLKFTFKNDRTVKREGNLITFMYNVGITRWHEYKRWNRVFDFSIIEDSIQELKGTNLEQYTNQVEDYLNAFTSFRNIEGQRLDEYYLSFLKEIYSNIAFEKLWKAGYKNLCLARANEKIEKNNWYHAGYYQATCNINWRGKKLEKILKCEPQKLDNLTEREDCNNTDVQACQRLTKYSLEQSSTNARIVTSLNFMELATIFEKNNLKLSKALKYIRNQSKKIDSSLEYVTREFYDYLNMQIKMETKLTSDVLFPTNVRVAHDKTVEIFNKQKDMQKNKEFVNAVKKYKDIAFKGRNYLIEVISNLKQLTKEASAMHNCSAGYVERIIDGESVLFVIREKKKPRTPFCMLELIPGEMRIVQNRGKYNAKAPQSAENFANKWLQNIVKPYFEKLAKEEKKKKLNKAS